MIIQNPLLTGSLNYNGADLSNVTSSNANSASVSLILTAVSSSNQQLSASYIALSASYNTFSGSASTRITNISASQQDISASLLQVSASYIALSGSYNTFSGSASTRVTKIENNYATTGSNSFRADQSITGSLVVSSTITAQTLVVQTVTSSIVYSSGSNNFGNQLANTQTFTGSVNITGSLALAGNITGNAITLTGAVTFANGGANYLYGGSTKFLYSNGTSTNNIYCSTNGLRVINAADTTILANFFDNGNLGIGTTTYTTTSGFTGVGINNATNGGCLDLLLNDVKKGELYISSTSFNMYGFAGVGLNLTVDNSAKGLAIATTGAATFSSSVTAQGINSSVYGLTIGNFDGQSIKLQEGTATGNTYLRFYSSAGGALGYFGSFNSSGTQYTLLDGSTTDLTLNGYANLYLQTGGNTRLTIASTGTAQFNSEDISGNRTTLNNVLTITQTNGNAPYSGFGSGILFKGTTYNGGGAGIPATRSWGRIAMQITDSSYGNTGENMLFQVAALDNSDALTTALTLAYNSAATFASSVTVGGSISATIGTLSTTYNGGSVGQLHITSNGTEGGTITFEKTSGTAQKYKLGLGTTSLFIYNETAGNQPFTLTSGGDVGIGNTAFSSTRLTVSGKDNTSSNYSIVANNSSNANIFLIRNDGLIAYPKINDFTTGNSPNTWINPSSSYGIYINTSSIRYKKDVINYDKGIDIVNQLRPVYYKGISEVDGDKQFAGLIAEEIHDLGLTEFVNYNEEGAPNSLSYPNMIALAFKAIQELKATNDNLQTQINELKAS